GHTDSRRQRVGSTLDLTRREREAMVGARSGRRGHAFQRVEPVHPGATLWLPPRDEVARITQGAGSAAEKVRVKGDDEVRLIKAVLRVDVVSEGELGAGPLVVAARRVPLMPRCRRKTLEHLADLFSERR